MQFIRLVQRMPDNAYMPQVTEFDDDDESDDESDDDMGSQEEEIPKMLEPRKRKADTRSTFWRAVCDYTGSSGRMCVPLPTRKQ